MRVSALAAVLVVGFSCGPKNSMVGTWNSGVGGANTTYHFRADGTYTIENQFDAIFSRSSGKYSLEGDRLVLTPETADVQGREPEASQTKGLLMQPSRVPIRWNTPASLTIVMPGVEGGIMLSRMSTEQ